MMAEWILHKAERVVIDEAHLNSGIGIHGLVSRHLAMGAVILGLTATPIDLGTSYDHLLICGTNSELRECGALVGALHYAPDEPDYKTLKNLKVAMGKDLSEREQRMVMMPNERVRHVLWGRILYHYQRLNPSNAPTILFGPDVESSLWLAEKFHEAGIPSAHIDGETVWVCGQAERTCRSVRQQVLQSHKDGGIRVICNRFVLREGIDMPWLSHCILATIFGSLQSYLQSVGRVLRAYPGLEHVTIQDHGGNWWRHGSANDDREWQLTDSATSVSGLREERLREKKEKEPFLCPKCHRVWQSGTRCGCGYNLPASCHSRTVIEIDGHLHEQLGDIYCPRRIYQHLNAQQLWAQMYWRARSKKWDATFRQAEAMFAYENDWYWPPRTLPLMPLEERDWFLKVADVPKERLR
jgi:superfamily II DNA or RNA helicase